MIVVTGGAGFIGSQLIAGLNRLDRDDIVAVDDLQDGKKFINLANNRIADYMDKRDFRESIQRQDKSCDKIELIFHQGACTTTTEWNGQYMMDNNYTYSKELLHFAHKRSIPFIYASSAAVYGISTTFTEELKNETPVNIYGYSKLLFDHYVRALEGKSASQVTGLRYFNVYGPGEAHKGNMASAAFHFNNQLKRSDEVKLFKGSHGYADGKQSRDFIFVNDVVNVNLWMMQNPTISGIYNVGTGKANSFNAVADTVIKWHGSGTIKYIPFPDQLKTYYQSFTEADIRKLRAVGYDKAFTPLDIGIRSYMAQLNSAQKIHHK